MSNSQKSLFFLTLAIIIVISAETLNYLEIKNLFCVLLASFESSFAKEHVTQEDLNTLEKIKLYFSLSWQYKVKQLK